MNGFAQTGEGPALIARTAKHFAHKVPVTTSEGHASIETRFGRAEVTAVDGGIAIVITPTDEEARDALRDVIASHLERFARGPFHITWR